MALPLPIKPIIPHMFPSICQIPDFCQILVVVYAQVVYNTVYEKHEKIGAAWDVCHAGIFVYWVRSWDGS